MVFLLFLVFCMVFDFFSAERRFFSADGRAGGNESYALRCRPFGSLYFLFIRFGRGWGGGGRERETSERNDGHLWIRTREESGATDAIPVASRSAHANDKSNLYNIAHVEPSP